MEVVVVVVVRGGGVKERKDKKRRQLVPKQTPNSAMPKKKKKKKRMLPRPVHQSVYANSLSSPIQCVYANVYDTMYPDLSTPVCRQLDSFHYLYHQCRVNSVAGPFPRQLALRPAAVQIGSVFDERGERAPRWRGGRTGSVSLSTLALATACAGA